MIILEFLTILQYSVKMQSTSYFNPPKYLLQVKESVKIYNYLIYAYLIQVDLKKNHPYE